MRRRLCLTAGIAALTLVVSALPAGGIDGDDPSVFGPGEAWDLGALRRGSAGHWVAELQMALNQAGFRAGRVDAVFGSQTVAAVHAFQKLHGLERDAVFLPEHWDLLDVPVVAPGPNGEPDRIEVDLDRQILYLIEDAELVRILPVSSASGAAYVNYAGQTVTSRTPEGRFAFNRQRSGWHRSYLGFMYAPFYFRGGYAIHGSGSVPAYPASHGCVRVTIDDMDYLRRYVHLGMPVYVYGNRLDRVDLLPTPPAVPPPRRLPAEIL